MSRKIYNRLSFMAVSSLDESTLACPILVLPAARPMVTFLSQKPSYLGVGYSFRQVLRTIRSSP